MVNVLILIIATLFQNSSISTTDYEVNVTVSGIEKKQGEIRIAIYSPENDFLSNEDIMDHHIIPVKSSEVNVTFTVKEKGNYAMALIHDVNKNGKMDFNVVGYPKEPYAFSNNPGIWFRKPTFAECAIRVDSSKSIEIKLK